MTKLKEVIYKHKLDANRRYKDGSVTDAMKEYAELYAKKCLEIAAKQSKCSLFIKSVNNKKDKYKKVEDGESWNIMDYKQMTKVNKDSILNIKLPEHL